MCRLLAVSRSGYYAWRHRGESARVYRNRELARLIRQVHLESRGVYGARKVHRELLAFGEACGRHRVARLMREAGLKGCPKRRFRRRADTPVSHPIAANVLNQDFTATRVNERWASDITFISTRQGWLYLAVVMDLYSRRIVGWAMDRRVARHLVLEAMRMALRYRRPRGPLLHHSDRGPQYLSDDFRDLLDKHGIECSMSARGHCYDNAPVESFFSLLKRERIRRRIYPRREEAKADVFDYIEVFYNRRRRHASLDYLSPVEFENQAMKA
jgi:putative transposase